MSTQLLAYLDTLFYFSLKKTGDRFEAEELAQEIVYEAVVTLNKGYVPNDFSSWLWGVARNCYARWVGKHKKRNEEEAAKAASPN